MAPPPTVNLKQVGACNNPPTTTSSRLFLAPLDKWKDFIAAEAPTVTNNLMSTFPTAAAPFLNEFTIGKNMTIESSITNVGRSGVSGFQHGLKLVYYGNTSTDIKTLQDMVKCGAQVAIVEKTPLSGDGQWQILGSDYGLEIGPDGDYTRNLSLEGGVATLMMKTNIEAERIESKEVIILETGTTLTDILSNVTA